MDKIFLFGAGGLIGKAMFKQLKERNVSIFTKNTFNIYEEYLNTNIENRLNDIILENSFVINCTSMTKYNKDNIKEFIVVNGIWPHVLSKVCHKRNSRLINISTDCVFKINSNVDTCINSTPSSTDIYGMLRFLGEPTNCLNIRTSVIGENNNNKGIIEWAKRKPNEHVKGEINQIWNGVTSLDLSIYITKIIDGKIEYEETIQHLASTPDGISKNELIKTISDAYKLNIKVDEIKTDTNKYIILSNCIYISNDIKQSIFDMANQ